MTTLKLRGRHIHISHGSYYDVVSAGVKIPKWTRLSRVADGHAALNAALDTLLLAPQHSGMQRAIADYLRGHLPTLTPAVRTEHARMFGKLAAVFDQHTVDQVRPRDCLQFLEAVSPRPSARQAYKYRMSAFFAWCVIHELRPTNPLREITIKQPPRHRTRWTDALFTAVAAQLDPMMRCYHELSFLLFQRTTDIRHLERRQIAGDLIHFTPSKTAATTGASISIRITPQIRAVLERAEALSKAAGRISPYVVHTSTGTAYTRSGIYSAYRRADTALHGRPIGLNPKDLRPYAATRAEAQGHSLRDIQRHMAHASQGTTEGYIQINASPVSEIGLELPDGESA